MVAQIRSLLDDDRPPRDFVPPRVGTPRNPDCPTYGPEIARVSERLGTPFMPHQQHAADVVYEVDPDTGRLRYDEAVISAMRQIGKTVWVRGSKVWRVTRGPKVFGQSQIAMYTAQKRQVARKRLERDFIAQLRSPHAVGTSSFVEITNPKARPGRSTREWKASLNNGQEQIEFGRGNIIQIDAPNREAGHSDTLDEATLDEAFALKNDDVESGVTPTMLTRDSSLLKVVSAAGDHQSFYFWPKVRDGRKLVESGRSTSTCYLEWSLPPDAAIDDVEAWWEFIPALNRTIRVSKLRAQLERARESTEDDALDRFRRGACNQWPRVPIVDSDDREVNVEPATWSAQNVGDDAPPPSGDVGFGVAISPNGNTTAIAVAGRDDLGRVQVEIAYYEPGTFWLETRISGMTERHRPIGVGFVNQAATRALGPEIRRAVTGTGSDTKVVPLGGSEWSASCAGFVIAFGDGRATHTGQTILTRSLEGARKKWSGLDWSWDWLTSRDDLAPLAAATAAVRVIEMHLPDVDEGAPNLW